MEDLVLCLNLLILRRDKVSPSSERDPNATLTVQTTIARYPISTTTTANNGSSIDSVKLSKPLALQILHMKLRAVECLRGR